MSSQKVAIKIELDKKIICTKKFVLDEKLDSIREKLKSKIGNSQFLEKGEGPIEYEDEKDFTLEEVIKDNILILSSAENNNDSGAGVKIMINDKNVCTKNCSLEDNLKNLRNSLKHDIKNEFNFLDKGGIDIDLDDEEDFTIKEILNNGCVQIKSNSSPAPISNTATSTFNPSSISSDEQGSIAKSPTKENKKITFDFSKYEVIKKEEDVTFYRYSNLKSKSNHELVYHYYFDKFESNDYRKAYIVLFVGKTGDGKSTGINAFFNVIKGIKLTDAYRFILIEEQPKKKGESVTDGVHLYYLRDYENKPIIILDSQGYGDTRGRKYDEMINSAFQYVFSNVIDHINVVCFIANATASRLDILTKYIFTSVTSLFSEDISENLFILATHANRDTMNSGPAFITTIGSDEAFISINKKMDEKFWFASDNKLIFYRDTDKLSLYSYNQLLELYEEKVKKMGPKGVKNSANVLNYRKQLTVEINKLNNSFQEMMAKNANLKEKEKKIQEKKEKLTEININLKNEEERIRNLKGKELENALKKMNENLEAQLSELKNQKIPKKHKILKGDSENKYTICTECQRNCHDPCDCWFKFLFKRCTIFPIFSNDCEECGHNKCVHESVYKHYIWETEEIDVDNSELSEKIKSKNKTQENFLKEQIDKDNREKATIQQALQKLELNKSQILSDLENANKEKMIIENKVKDIEKEISYTIIRLQNLNEKLNEISMNPNVIKTQNEYYKSLKEKMKDIGIEDKEQEEYLNGIIKENENIEKINNLSHEELLSLSEEKLKSLFFDKKN